MSVFWSFEFRALNLFRISRFGFPTCVHGAQMGQGETLGTVSRRDVSSNPLAGIAWLRHPLDIPTNVDMFVYEPCTA